MLTRRLVIILFLVAVGVALTAQAQQGQPITQPTIDAAVGTLIAQTQQAPANHAATQTIQAALGQALTATAFAQITPTPTPQPLDVADLAVRSTTEIDLLAGPGGTSAYLAPDGQHFAYLSQNSFCLYQGQAKGNCVDVSSTGGVESESPRWSPDSRYVVFTQDFFRTFRDPDIWVWDTISNQLNDLTPNQGGRINFLTAKSWTGVDISPRWLPDGRILFLRYSRQNGVVLPPDVYVIAPDGSGLQRIGRLAVSDQFAVFALDASATHLIYNYDSQGGSPMDGLWISDLDGDDAHQLTALSHDTQIWGVQLSPDGKYALVTTVYTTASPTFTPETSPVSVVDLATGQRSLIDPDHYVSAAGWAPQGSALVYVTHDVQQPDNDTVYLTSAPGAEGQPLSSLQGRFNVPTSRLQQALVWSANNTILFARIVSSGIVLVQLGG